VSAAAWYAATFFSPAYLATPTPHAAALETLVAEDALEHVYRLFMIVHVLPEFFFYPTCTNTRHARRLQGWWKKEITKKTRQKTTRYR
jgi:hypothetical protein